MIDLNHLPPEKHPIPQIISKQKPNSSKTSLTEKANFFLFNSPQFITQLNPESTPAKTNETGDKVADFIILPIGINIGNRPVINSTLIRGLEDGSQAISLEKWLIPLDDVSAALKLNITYLKDGQIEIRSPGLVTRINSNELQTDPQLGLVISVQQIEKILKVPTEFNILKYSLVFNPPWLNLKGQKDQINEPPVILEGLPKINPPHFNLTTLGEKVTISSQKNTSPSYQGELSAIGTVLGGSWFLQINQPDLVNTTTWQIREAQFLRQTDAADYIIGSQSPFWRNQTGGEFWGLTTIQRQGFSPPTSLNTSGGFNINSRLQPKVIKNTISGDAKPGTLVRLVRGISDAVINEFLVDSSGVYRFENVASENGFGNYRILLYPNGQLTATPEIQEAKSNSLPGQLSKGNSALVVSAGMRREVSGNESLIGNFSDFRGGIAYRRGVTEDLTLGIGAIHDQSEWILGEAFYLPKGLPIELAISALTNINGADFGIQSNLRFQPARNFTTTFSSDIQGQHDSTHRFDTTWQVSPRLAFLANGNSRDSFLGAGLQYSYSQRDFYTYVRAFFDTNQYLRWNLNTRWQNLQFIQQGNELSTNSELNYTLLGKTSNSTHSVFLNYETRNSDNLGILGWRYRSPQKLNDSGYLWQVDLGYGIGSQGHGTVVSASTGILPAIDLRLRYQSISTVSDDSSFRIEFVPRLNFTGGISAGDSRFDKLRNQGGLLIQPFFDKNNNGIRDDGEALYTEDANLLLIVNNKPIKALRPDIRRNGIYINLSPDSYRLDTDPAGLPPDWQAVTTSYAVKVVSGSYTSVLVPMIPSYTVTGIVTNTKNKPIPGARVEAIHINTGKAIISITNDAGAFYLEQLAQGTYNLLINGKPANPKTLTIDAKSKSFLEINPLITIP
ncbi:carboxypeptidase-like regulatory domain-containing protein [Dolichospermum sp. ST_con]|nr:carboxypeptidase-like regulatory domain-containing protein [Dolichospermum sp. ST_con]MDD1418335.1 carboxypeptidase-like regulatory domain-containing protein [Dolichospermum sp. ST_sed1]MDD1423688.1 carboxypeptidase-like regulatory domain-containing protein [Dolichospermum sp. ST_sed9]MDD1432689.1 carboxypeptidase-like regulatory domain-containing protein [Dolichospermum sp. ST_sed6]MDD1435808.1 carboxypeptidase-like regulatory domain-containing protein [Dolichospermum sp. ST_sed10]MDD14419